MKLLLQLPKLNWSLRFAMTRGALAVLLVGMAAATSGCLRVNRDAAALRDSLLNSADTTWNKKFEIGAGFLTLGATRLGLSFVDMEPEARAALQTVRGAEVGIYELRGKHPSPGAILNAADKVMANRGWERLVGVSKEKELVLVYLPKGTGSTRDVRVCVAVFQHDQLVIASARSNLEPIVQMVLNRPEWKEKVAISL